MTDKKNGLGLMIPCTEMFSPEWEMTDPKITSTNNRLP